MPTIFINLPHDKGSFEITPRNGRQQAIIKEFLGIVEQFSLDIDKQDLENILRISRL